MKQLNSGDLKRCFFEKASKWSFWLPVIIGALFLFPLLDIKPPQHDEGVNGWFIEEVIAKGFYEYDPANYHGPLHFYILFLFKLLLGNNLWALRIPTVLFSLATLFLFLKLEPYLGRWTVKIGCLFAAVSPGIIFYSRYAIHEAELYFFSVMSLLGFFRLREVNDLRACWLLGLGITGMLVTKETYIVILICFVLAVWGVRIYERFSPSAEIKTCPAPSYTRKDVFRVLFYCIFIYVILYSGFFLNWDGLGGIFRSFGDWFTHGVDEKAGQKGHFKPVIYWIQLFLRYEWGAFAGLLFCFPLLGPSSRNRRILALYGCGHLLLYSLIPYKTPWCILQLIWPFLFISAGGIQDLIIQKGFRRLAAISLMAVIVAVSAGKAVSLNFFHYADDSEPYVNVQTFKPVMAVIEKIKRAAADDPARTHLPVHIVMKSYWPISWLLVDFTKTYYYTDHFPPRADANVIFCDRNRRAALELKFKRKYFVENFRLNPAQDETTVYYDYAVFKTYFPPDAAIFEPVVFDPPKEGEGLLASYFANKDWQGDPVKREVIGTVDHSWEAKETPVRAPFGIMFEGEIQIPVSGEVKLFLASDDGSRLEISGKMAIDNLGDHAERIQSKSAVFEKGWYPVQIKFFDAGGAAVVRLWWQLPGGKEELIAPPYFRPRKVT